MEHALACSLADSSAHFRPNSHRTETTEPGSLWATTQGRELPRLKCFTGGADSLRLFNHSLSVCSGFSVVAFAVSGIAFAAQGFRFSVVVVDAIGFIRRHSA